MTTSLSFNLLGNINLVVPHNGFNPLQTSSNMVLSNGNRTLTGLPTGSTWATSLSLTGHNSGKYYAELAWDDNSSFTAFGVVPVGYPLSGNNPGSLANSWGIQSKFNAGGDVNLWLNGVFSNVAYSTGILAGKLAIDFGTGNGWLGTDSTWINSGDPETGSNPTFTFTPGTMLYLAGSMLNPNIEVITLNNYSSEFLQTIPSGFNAWS